HVLRRGLPARSSHRGARIHRRAAAVRRRIRMRRPDAARLPATPASLGDLDPSLATVGLCRPRADAGPAVGCAGDGRGALEDCRRKLLRCLRRAATAHGLERRQVGARQRTRRAEVVAAARSRRARVRGVGRGDLPEPDSLARTRVRRGSRAPRARCRRKAMTKRLQLAILLVLTVGVYIGTAGWPALLDDADASHALAARAMVESGDWAVLHINGVAWLEKPPLHYWLVATSFALL